MDTTVATNGTAQIEKRKPGRPRKDGAATTTQQETPSRRSKKSGVNKYLYNESIREFLLLPEEVQTSIRNLVRFEDTTSVEFDI